LQIAEPAAGKEGGITKWDKFAAMGFALKTSYLPHYTYEDYAQWEGNWELIGGVPYAMSPSPSFRHQRINTKILTQIDEKISGCKHCKAVMSFDWKIKDDTVVQPDVSVVCQPVKNNNFLDFAPSLIFEIISPSSEMRDRKIKLQLYQSERVRYYVIINGETEMAEVHQLKGTRYMKAMQTHDAIFTFLLAEDCKAEFRFSEIWKV